MRRWPDVHDWAGEPLPLRLAADHNARPFITFLMVSRRLQPGWDYLVARKLSSFWRDLDGSALQPDLDQFMTAARSLGFTQRVASAVASQIIARLLIQTGRRLAELTESDLADLTGACQDRQGVLRGTHVAHLADPDEHVVDGPQRVQPVVHAR